MTTNLLRIKSAVFKSYFVRASNHCRTVSFTTKFLKDTPDEEMDQLKGNPYFSKYAEKLQQKEQKDPAEFEKNVEKLRAEKEREIELKKQDAEDALNRARELKAKGLDGIVKLDLLRERTADEIKAIWLEHHKTKQCIYGVIRAEEFEIFHERIKAFPLFLYPLPRGEGYQYMFQQFEDNECHFTPLALYQEHKENAPQCLNIKYYTELQQEKGIILMNSDVNTDLISVHEAQLLALQVKMYYGLNAGLKFNHVRVFNNSPASFQHVQLVREFEKYKRDLKSHEDGTWV